MMALRISTVDRLVSGSTPPAWAVLTARSTSRITSLYMTSGISRILRGFMLFLS